VDAGLVPARAVRQTSGVRYVWFMPEAVQNNAGKKIIPQLSWRWWGVIFGGWTLYGLIFACQAYLNSAYFGKTIPFGRTLIVWLGCAYIRALRFKHSYASPITLRLLRAARNHPESYLIFRMTSVRSSCWRAPSHHSRRRPMMRSRISSAVEPVAAASSTNNLSSPYSSPAILSASVTPSV